MSRSCPNCNATMRPETVCGVGLDVCPECAGIWFDAEELGALLARDPESLSRLDSATTSKIEHSAGERSDLLCPDDKALLDSYHYLYNSPIVLHTCSRCGGFWIADGELAKMQQWREQAHRPLNAKEQAGVVLAEATVAHEKELAKSQNLEGLFSTLRRYPPGWFGFVP